MKKRNRIIAALTAITTACTLTAQLPLSVQAANPIVQTSFTPDPAPVVFGDELWVFTGCDADGADNYVMTGWQAFSTTDMQNWTDHGRILEDDEFSWCTEKNAWASQCIERNGKYYFYFTTTTNGRAIGVGVADSPEGPYKDVLGKPLCGPNWDYIDPTVIIDDDGQAYLMFGNPKCYYVKLKEDMVTLDGEIKQFDMTTEAFGSGKRGSAYGEGPWIYKHDDLYYLVYASFYGNDSGESQCYSTAPSVTGPWTFRGQIQEQSNCFTTHGGIIDYKGHSYFFYHKNGLSGGGVFDRSASCEEFTYNPDGTIPKVKFTNAGPAQLEYVNPYQRMEAEMINWSEGIKTEKIDAGTLAIGFIENNDYVKVSGIDFGESGAEKFYASVSSNGQGGTIELHLDSVTGTKIGSVEVPVTGGWQEWTTVDCAVSGATGTHDVYYVFKGGDSYLFNVDWWQFTEVGGSTDEPGAQYDQFGGKISQIKSSGLLGDVNGDNRINATDMSLARAIMMNGTKDSKRLKAADVNCSGKVELADIVWYIKFLTGQTKDYPEKVAPEVEPYNYPENMSFFKADEDYFKKQPANHGEVKTEYYSGINGDKKMYVYVPYGYDESKQYNVFYLMHGGNESEETCFNDNNINIDVMLDNMIAAGQIEPMIVVTPTFNGAPSADGVNEEMRKSIIPYVEQKYSTYANGDTSIESLKASRFHRAYGGFSMGGGSTWANLRMNIDIIAYFMPLSGHCWDGAGAVINAIKQSGLSQRDYFIFAATGTGDVAYNNMVPMINELKKDTEHFTYTCDFSKGNLFFLEAPGETHWWGIVRHYIYDGLPLFFHEGN